MHSSQRNKTTQKERRSFRHSSTNDSKSKTYANYNDKSTTTRGRTLVTNFMVGGAKG